ncbi:zinc finger, CCHC-type containing protein [Tanacetum coccineum]
MVVAAMKHMASNFAKLDKFKGMDFKRWQKKMHFLLSSMSVVGLILNGMSDLLFDIYQNVEYSKELWDSLEAKYMAEDALSKKFLVSNFTNYKMTYSRPVMEQYNELLGILKRFKPHKINMDKAIQVSCIIDKLPPSWKDFKHTLKHRKGELTIVELGSHLHIEESLRVQDSDKPKGNNVVGPSVVNMVEHNNSSRHLKKDYKGEKVGNKANGSGTNSSVDSSTNLLKGKNMFNKSLRVYYVTYVSKSYYVQDEDIVWWVDSGATMHVCKDRCWFKTYESLNDGSILHIGNESTALVHRRGCVDLRLSSGKIVSLFNVLHVPNIRKNLVSSSVLNSCGYKQVIESNKFVLSKHAFMSTSKLNDSILWHARLGHVHFKWMQDMSKDGLIPTFDMDTEKCMTCMLTKITKKPFQNIKCETEVLKLIHSGLCDLHATPSLGNKNLFVTFIDNASRAVVRLSDPKLKTLGERGIECIFVGYAEHSKAFRFSSVPRLSLKIPNGTEDIGDSVVPEEVVQQPEPEFRKSKKNRTPKNFGLEFQLYLIEGTRDEVSDQHSYCFNVEDNPRTFDEAIKSQNVAF